MFHLKNFPLKLRVLRETNNEGPLRRYLRPLFSRSCSTSSDVRKGDGVIERAIEGGEISELPATFNFVRDIIDLWAKRKNALKNDVPALWMLHEGKSTTYTFEELSQLSKRVAGIFRDCGMDKGDRVLMCLPKCAEFWFVMLAAFRCGVEFTAVTTQATVYDLQYRIEHFKPKMVISNKIQEVDIAIQNGKTQVEYKVSVLHDDANWLKLSSLMKSADDFDGHRTSPDDPAMVFFTSGTTGRPKMVEHSHSYVLSHLFTGKHFMALQENDVFWCMTDPGWAKVAYETFPTWLYGSCCFVETSPRFSPHDVLKTLRNYPITKLCAPPTVYRQLIKERKEYFNFKALNDCFSAGEPLNAEAYTGWKNLTNISIREAYGQTETPVLVCNPFGLRVKPGSMGPPRTEMQVNILDRHGNQVKQGEVGELGIRVTSKKPIGFFKGYRGNEKRTADSFKHGYYLTGDRAYHDEEGYLYFVSRSDDVITSSGYRIGPFEIESVILEHPAVVESAVIGVPDPDRFEIVKAFVVLTDEYKNYDKHELTTELQNFVKERTAPYKYPRQIEFVDSLPKTVSDKVQRALLRQRHNQI